MKTLKILTLLTFVLIARWGFAQEMPIEINAALKIDDAAKFASLVNRDNMNSCYQEGNWGYNLLAQTVRRNAKKCFDYLIAQGVDVNKACDGYVPPLMHAAKYGRLEMVKILVAKGARTDYVYEGDYEPANGQTPLTYAEANKQTTVADYLRSLKKN